MKLFILSRKIFGCSLLFVMLSLPALSQVTVSDCNLNGWIPTQTSTATITFQNGPAVPPMGTGSARHSVGADGDAASQMRTAIYNGTLLSSFTEMKYWTFTQQDGSGGQAPYLLLNIDLDNNGSTDDQLFFEPVYQTPGYGQPLQGPLAVNVWQQWDALTGGWWSLNAGTFGPPLVSFASYSAAHPGARLATTAAGSFRIVTGFGSGAWDNYIGNSDAVRIGVNGNTTTYDFESCDPDGDGIPSPNDNCPTVFNPSQANNDGDSMGDVCDPDDDNDGVPDAQDNCPFTANANQTDTDSDGLGNACDPDDDNDGIPDQNDNCPLLPGTNTACTLAYNGVAPTGNQAYGERLGMDFTVNSPIVVTRLGAYDDGGNGLMLPITVGIVNSSGATVAGPITLSGSGDPLVAGHRMRTIPAVTLGPGQYTIVAVGYGAAEMNGNNNVPPPYPNTVFNNGGGKITSNHSSYGGVGFGKPTTFWPDKNEFHAGTFCFSAPATQSPDFDNDGIGDPCDEDDDNDGVPDPYDCEPFNKKKDKWMVCHNGHTLCIAEPAVQAHLNHGDQLGACANGNRGSEPVFTYIEDLKLTASPNPATSSTRITYELTDETNVRIVLFDAMGKQVKVLVDGFKNPGAHLYELNTTALTGGMYYYRMEAESGGQKSIQTNKLMIVK